MVSAAYRHLFNLFQEKQLFAAALAACTLTYESSVENDDPLAPLPVPSGAGAAAGDTSLDGVGLGGPAEAEGETSPWRPADRRGSGEVGAGDVAIEMVRVRC